MFYYQREQCFKSSSFSYTIVSYCFRNFHAHLRNHSALVYSGNPLFHFSVFHRSSVSLGNTLSILIFMCTHFPEIWPNTITVLYFFFVCVRV